MAATDTQRASVPAVRAGRRVAALFDAHGRMVLALCRTILRDERDAEDAAQQTFLSAHRALLAGTRPLDPPAWLATIARNECRGRIARRLAAPDLVPLAEGAVEAGGSSDPEAQADQNAQLDALTAALAELPERQREAVVLRDLYGLSYGEVAAAMSISPPAVESLLWRGRRGLQARVRPLRLADGAVALSSPLREELARLIPGFATETGAAAVGGGAVGVVAKVMSASISTKVAAGVAVATVAVGGSDVATVERASERAAAARDPVVARVAQDRAAPVLARVELVRAASPRRESATPVARPRRAAPRPERLAAEQPAPVGAAAAEATAVAPAAAPPTTAAPEPSGSGESGGSSGPGGGDDETSSSGPGSAAPQTPETDTSGRGTSGSGSGESGSSGSGESGSSGSGGSGSSGSGSSGPGSGDGDETDNSGPGGGGDEPDEPDEPESDVDEPDEPDD